MHFFDPIPFIKTAGLFGISFIILFESGIPLGFFLPGASLLFAAGILASAGYFSLTALLFMTFISAVIGDIIGFYLGVKIGDVFLTKEHRFIKKEHIEKTQRFFQTHGKKAIIIARFIPVIRTFTPILAGVAKMKVKDFFSYNIIGAFMWTWGTILLAYFLGQHIPNLEKYLLPICIGIIIITLIPAALEMLSKDTKTEIQK